MLFKAFSFANLAQAVILFPLSSFTLNKVCKGSKSDFAYLLMGFTIADAFCKLSAFIMYLFPYDSVQLPNAYAAITN